MFRPRWYVDADTLGLAQLLAEARPDVTFPGDDGKRKKRRLNLPPCVIKDPKTDDVWIPRVTQEGLAIITRDVHIQERIGEIRAVLDSGAQMFAITTKDKAKDPDGATNYNWDLLEIVVKQWRAMELQREQPGPWIFSVTRTSIKQVDLSAYERESA